MPLWSTKCKLRKRTVIHFGQYNGKTLKAIHDLDRGYFLWLLTHTKLSKEKHSNGIYRLIHGHDTYYGQCRAMSVYPEDIEIRPSEGYTRYYFPTDDENKSLLKWAFND